MPQPDISRNEKAIDHAFDAIHGDMLRDFDELVLQHGGDPDVMMQRVGIGQGMSSRSNLRASYRQFVNLLELTAVELGCPDFGMQLAVRQAGSAFVGPLGDGMRHSRTFGDALQFVCSHSYAHSLAAWIWLKPTMSGTSTVVGHDILLEGLPQKSQAMEYILLVGNLATLDLTEGRVRARRILFRHQPVSPIKIYRQNFGCDIRFGRSADAVIYNKHDMDCTISGPNAEAHQIAADLIESRFSRRKPPLYADIRGFITHILETEPCNRDRVASALGFHPRTLVRRLAEEGTSFQRIKDEVRQDLLLYYVRHTGLNFTTISEKLGFAEQAVMTRFCRKWFGISPGGLRLLLRTTEPD